MTTLPLNPRIAALQESATIALADRVRALRAAGREVVALQTGDPDFGTPAPIVEAAHRALRDGLTHYGDSRGSPKLREAIAAQLASDYGVAYDPGTEILVTCGGIHAYYCALQAVLGPGAEVLVPDPAWMPHVNVVELLGGRVRRVPGKPENRFWPTLEDWEKQVSPSTVALVINSPNNPTGYVADRDYLSGVAAFASRHGLYILSDEVYHKLLYDGCPHACMASLPGARERTLLINSFSKTYAMTGWRVGFLAGPSRIIGEALKASQYSITNVPPFIQEAAREALVGKEIQGIVRRMLDVYDRRRNLVVSLWGQGSTKARIAIPDGAFYFFLDVRDVGRSSIEVAQDFLSSTGVAMVPGSVYGPSGEGFLRMTIAASDDVVRTGTLSLLAWIAQHIDRSV